MLVKIEGKRRSGWQRVRLLDGITDLMDINLSKPQYSGRTDAEAPTFWPPDPKSRLIGKDPDAEKTEDKRRRGQQRMRLLALLTQWT